MSKFQLRSLFQKSNTSQDYRAKWRNIMHSSYTDHYKLFESEKGHYKEGKNSKTFQSYISRHLKLEIIFSLKLINLDFVTYIETFASK